MRPWHHRHRHFGSLAGLAAFLFALRGAFH